VAMSNYIWKIKFKIDHLLTERPIKDASIEFFSPHFPSTEKDKDYTEGELTISLSNLNYSAKEIVTEGLRTVIALTNHVNLLVQIISIESPPGVLPSLKMEGSSHSSPLLKEAERIPHLWDKYQMLISNNYRELSYAVQWFMRAIKAQDSIDKFIYSWISFNMLYGWLAQTRNHIKGIKGLLGKGIPNLRSQKDIVSGNQKIFEELSRMTLLDACNLYNKNVDRAEKLRKALQGRDAKEILIAAIEAIGFIRHNIFHGNLSNKTAEAERCIWPLIHLNAEIIKNQLEKI
jgi:hypothetical protein